MSWTLCTSGSAILKAGTHANSTIVASGSLLADLSDMAEGRITAETRKTWVSGYSGLNTQIKGALSDVCSSMIALNIIAYDTTGYLTREADTLMNLNDEIVSKGMIILKDFKTTSLQSP